MTHNKKKQESAWKRRKKNIKIIVKSTFHTIPMLPYSIDHGTLKLMPFLYFPLTQTVLIMWEFPFVKKKREKKMKSMFYKLSANRKKRKCAYIFVSRRFFLLLRSKCGTLKNENDLKRREKVIEKKEKKSKRKTKRNVKICSMKSAWRRAISNGKQMEFTT